MKTQFRMLLSVFVCSVGSALPATITGGTTSVALDITLVSTVTGAGITPAAVPPGTLAAATATFPINGGDTTTGVIDHSGGLSFTKGTSSALIENFVINVNTKLLSGEVIANGGTPTLDVDLFDIGSNNKLTIDSALASDLTAVFGVPNLTGATVGVATVSPITGSPVPEPSALALLALGGAVLVGMCRWTSASLGKRV